MYPKESILTPLAGMKYPNPNPTNPKHPLDESLRLEKEKRKVEVEEESSIVKLQMQIKVLEEMVVSIRQPQAQPTLSFSNLHPETL